MRPPIKPPTHWAATRHQPRPVRRTTHTVTIGDSRLPRPVASTLVTWRGYSKKSKIQTGKRFNRNKVGATKYTTGKTAATRVSLTNSHMHEHTGGGGVPLSMPNNASKLAAGKPRCNKVTKAADPMPCTTAADKRPRRLIRPIWYSHKRQIKLGHEPNHC